MNPVNAYLRPHFERIFAEFIERRSCPGRRADLSSLP